MPPGQSAAAASGNPRPPPSQAAAPKKRFDIGRLKFWKRKNPASAGAQTPTPKKKKFNFERLKFWNRQERKRKEREAREEEERRKKAAAEASRARRQQEEEGRQRQAEETRRQREAEEQQRQQAAAQEEERHQAESLYAESTPIITAPMGMLDIPTPDGLQSPAGGAAGGTDIQPADEGTLPIPDELLLPPVTRAPGVYFDPSLPPPAYPNSASLYKAQHGDPLRKIAEEEHASQQEPFPRFSVPTGDPNSPMAEFPTRSKPAPPPRRALALPNPSKVLPPYHYAAPAVEGTEFVPTQPMLTHIYTGLHAAHVGYVPAAPINPLLFSSYSLDAGDTWRQANDYGKPLSLTGSPRPAYYHPGPPWVSRGPLYDAGSVVEF